jgi:cardiolipin synthase
LHRKLVVIDGRLAFCGGINLKDDRDNAGTDPPRYDFSVKVEGPLVGDMHRAARRLWLMTELRNLTHSGHSRMRRSLPPPALPNGQLAQFLTRDNWLNRRRIEDAYVVAVQSAAREIVIANAYFLPGRRIRQALLAATTRGVRVVLLLQGRPDHLLIYYATQALYASLIKGGIEIFEYSPAHLHAKVAVVDDHWATVGSSNIDPFSLWLCREANVVFHDLTLVETLRKSLALAIAERSQPITLDITNHRSCYERLRAWAIHRLGRFLIGLTGFATRDEL